MENEVWKSVIDYENYYEVSNQGKVRSVDRYVNGKNNSVIFLKSKILKPAISINGYKRVTLCKEGKCSQFFIHRLVGLVFLSYTDTKRFINHIDGNKLNNNVSNLEWCTHSENVQHAYKTGLTKPKGNRKGINGYLHHRSKVVLQYSLDNKFIKEYGSIHITKQDGFTPQHVHSCCQGKLKTHKNFKWCYKN